MGELLRDSGEAKQLKNAMTNYEAKDTSPKFNSAHRTLPSDDFTPLPKGGQM